MLLPYYMILSVSRFSITFSMLSDCVTMTITYITTPVTCVTSLSCFLTCVTITLLSKSKIKKKKRNPKNKIKKRKE